MSILNVTCSHCSRVTKIPAQKVPDHPVAYRCPSCKGKIVIDKKKLLAGTSELADSPPAAQAGGPSGKALPSPTVEVEELMLPPGESLPPGFLVAEDDQLASQLIEALKPYDGGLERLPRIEDLRRRMGSDVSPLIIYLAKTLGKPPYAPLAPLMTLPPRDRRRTFVTLIGSDATTLDGNQAFLYQVDLLLNHQHISKAAGILYSGLRYHQRLYRAYFEALGETP